MAGAGGAAVLTGGVGLLERAIGYALGNLQAVTPESLTNPTVCRDWDLRALLRHMNDSLATLHECITSGDLDLDAAEDAGGTPAELVATFRARAGGLLGAWTGAAEVGSEGVGVVTIGGRPITTGSVAVAGAIEIAVHGWDISQACGRRQPIPDALALAMLEFSPLMVADADRSGLFADPVPVPASAAPGDRLVAFLGRDPAGSGSN